MSTDFSEQSRIVIASNDANEFLLKSEDFSKRVFKHRDQEIELFLGTEQTSTPEQILDYLEIHKQYQDGLEHIFFPQTQSSSTQTQVPLDRGAKMERILSRLRHDTDSMLHQGSLLSRQTQTCHNFLQKYNTSLKKSIILLQKLYPILKQRADDLEITVSRKIDALEIKVEKNYSLMSYLLRIAEYLRKWSLQLIHDPKECDLDKFVFVDPAQIEPRKKDSIRTKDSTVDERLEVHEEKKDMNLFDQNEKLTRNFNSMVDICIEEIQDFKELTKMMQSGERLERIQQRANEQELSMNVIYKTSQLRIDKWTEWRDEIVKYLSSWTSTKPLPSTRHPHEYRDFETGDPYAKI